MAGLLLTAFLPAQDFGLPWPNNLIPQPASLVKGTGWLELPQQPVIIYNDPELKPMAAQLARQITTVDGAPILKSGSKPLPKSVFLSLTNESPAGDEAYRLSITAAGITLQAKKPAGIFYGLQTLLQLFPASAELPQPHDFSATYSLPVLTIEDQPRFAWRGLMLDVSRHFFTVKEVKAFIDQMVKYKFNLLHLHLTDDQGWRIEIKSWPKLTSTGAWRVEKTGTFGRFSKPEPNEPKNYGGFYTQEDIKEIVRYAKERFVNIMPEIDVPGHSMAAIAAYPELCGTPGNYSVNAGEKFMEWPGGGQHFYGLIDNTLNPANEKVYSFLNDVFTEVAALFPFDYIHMGGDETARNFWEKTESIKQLMQKEKLKNLDEVQSYFVKRVEKIINNKGKKMIGWDEILDGGLAPNAAVMSWRGMKGGIEAAKQGHEVVMSPTDFAYLDYMQGDASIEPPVYATLRLKKTYQFEPVPDGVNAALIKGGQANIWTEQIYNTRHLQYMLWPRGFAIAESLWSPKEKKDWKSFVHRVESHFDRLNNAGVKYAPSMYDPVIIAGKKDSITLVLKLETEIEGLSIHYSFDNSFPDQFYPAYKEPIVVPKDASTFKVVTYRDGEPAGRLLVVPISDLKKRAGIK